MLTANATTWPRGFKAFVDYAHAREIKVGAYTDTGEFNCCAENGVQEPGSFGHEVDDITTFASWGVDHVAVDNCDNPYGGSQSVQEYLAFHDAMVQVGHPMVYGVWSVGFGKPWAWAPRLGHYWRSAADLGNRWGQNTTDGGPSGHAGIMYNYDIQQSIPAISALSGPGSYAFLDQLMVGQVPGVPHGAGDIGLTTAETRTHFALWAIMTSPLWLTHDIFNPPPGITALVSNKDAIAISQDPLGAMAVRIDGSANSGAGLRPRLPGYCEAEDIWPNGEQLAKPLANGDTAVLLFNRLERNVSISLNFEDIGDTTQRCFIVRDVWSGRNLGMLLGQFIAEDIPPHGDRFLRLTPCNATLMCPSGYVAHAAGFWANNVPCPRPASCNLSTHACSAGGPPCQFGVSVEQCAALCSRAQDCVGFEVFQPYTESVCYTFHGQLQAPFTPDSSCFTCAKTP